MNDIKQLMVSDSGSGFDGIPTVGDTSVLFTDATDKINTPDLATSNVFLTMKKVVLIDLSLWCIIHIPNQVILTENVLCNFIKTILL